MLCFICICFKIFLFFLLIYSLTLLVAVLIFNICGNLEVLIPPMYLSLQLFPSQDFWSFHHPNHWLLPQNVLDHTYVFKFFQQKLSRKLASHGNALSWAKQKEVLALVHQKASRDVKTHSYNSANEAYILLTLILASCTMNAGCFSHCHHWSEKWKMVIGQFKIPQHYFITK